MIPQRTIDGSAGVHGVHWANAGEGQGLVNVLASLLAAALETVYMYRWYVRARKELEYQYTAAQLPYELACHDRHNDDRALGFTGSIG